MKKLYTISLMAIMLLTFQVTFSQVDDQTVELDEVVLSLPFNQTLGKSVIKVDKINFNDLNPILQQYISKSISKLPGVSILSTGPGVSKPSIRGLSYDRVVVYSQGVRLENQQWGDEHGIGVSTSGINSIEVIKGPSYVLYGSDAMGGVLYVEPERYSSDFSVDYMGLYNSNYNGITNNLGLKGSSGKFSYIARANMVDNQSFSTPDGEVENTWFKENDVQAGLKYETEKFSSDLRLTMNFSELGLPHMEEGHDDHDDHDEEGHDDHDEEGHDDHEDHEDHYQELSHTTLSWVNTFDLGNDHQLNVTLGRQLNDRKEFGGHEEEEGHDDHDEEGHDDHDDHEGHEEGEAELDMELSTNTLDVSLVMPQSDNLNLTIGANFLSQENKNFGHEELIPDAEKKDFGLYALGQITMENGAALLGVRYDNRSISSDMGSADFSNFNGSVGIKRDFENSSLRFNIGSGYRAPNLVELFADGVHHGTFRYERGNLNLVAEKSFQTDISFDINNDDSSVSFDLFYNDISDYIYISPSSDREDGFAVYDYMQQDSELYGGEISFAKKTGFDWLSYNTSLEYIFAESADGEALPFISPLTFNQVFNIDISSNYSFEIDFLAKAKQGRVSMFEEETDGYSVLNLSGNWMTSFLDNDLNIFWSISNVFDKEYYDHLSRFKTAGIEEMGRNISVGLKYNF
ncbi:MAG: TonB-dependent receptor plug domain-containing protein [Candidatus Marisimplicoccus sp.]|tara:strand:+ start:115 stop:2175 length:2061 start_codon:yes stop_codon:yes gene_type:complete